MRRFLFVLYCTLLTLPAHAWNAAGHRLITAIAWQQLSPASQQFIGTALVAHPDHERWAKQARTTDPLAVFCEASNWPDSIRHDPRFYDETRDDATPPLPGLKDTARHKRWHYVDIENGNVVKGELDRQIVLLEQLLRSTRKNGEIYYLLPWLAHLVGDIHQPFHVGRRADDGGNGIEIENPFNKRLPFSSLHTYWDDLPGPPWLRGKRLEKNVAMLIETFPPPTQGDVTLWLKESHQLMDKAYPDTEGSLLPLISESFHEQARNITNRRLVDAGYRLGRLLEKSIRARVSRETP